MHKIFCLHTRMDAQPVSRSRRRCASSSKSELKEPKRRCREGYQRHNGRWEARYRPQTRCLLMHKTLDEKEKKKKEERRPDYWNLKRFACSNRFEIKPDAVIAEAFKGFTNGLYKYEFLVRLKTCLWKYFSSTNTNSHLCYVLFYFRSILTQSKRRILGWQR